MKANYYLLFDRINIQSANAISSPLTYGFPAVSGFVGAIHALSRSIAAESGIGLNGVLIACHRCDVQSFRPHSYADYTFNQSRNPIKKNGDTASIIEEGKAHLEVSLVVEVSAKQPRALSMEDARQAFAEQMRQKLLMQRIAGGSVQSIGAVQLYDMSCVDDIIIALLPGFVLLEARQELKDLVETIQNPQSEPFYYADASAFQALIETATLHHLPQGNEWQTKSIKTGRGWLVPMPVGFQGISQRFDAGEMAHCRSADYPSQYAECLYGLGKWVFPFRIRESFSNSFWRYQQPQDDIYLMTQTVN
jgi:CRISPR-associated protein Csy2